MALTDNLVSYWKLDESSGNAADSAGSNTLTNVNTATFAAGKINNGTDLELDSNQYFTSSAAGLGFTDDFSVSMWVKVETAPPDGGSSYTLFGKRDDDPANKGYYAIYVQSSSVTKIQTGFFTSASAFSYVQDNVDLGTGTWKHLVFTYDISVPLIKVYVDGSLVSGAMDLSNATTLGTATADFGLGNRGSGWALAFDGMIDEVGVWSRLLTADEVTSLYNSGSGLAYPFSSPSGPANLKSYNTNLKANIKSINTNLIANVKSLDTNV